MNKIGEVCLFLTVIIPYVLPENSATPNWQDFSPEWKSCHPPENVRLNCPVSGTQNVEWLYYDAKGNYFRNLTTVGESFLIRSINKSSPLLTVFFEKAFDTVTFMCKDKRAVIRIFHVTCVEDQFTVIQTCPLVQGMDLELAADDCLWNEANGHRSKALKVQRAGNYECEHAQTGALMARVTVPSSVENETVEAAYCHYTEASTNTEMEGTLTTSNIATTTSEEKDSEQGGVSRNQGTGCPAELSTILWIVVPIGFVLIIVLVMFLKQKCARNTGQGNAQTHASTDAGKADPAGPLTHKMTSEEVDVETNDVRDVMKIVTNLFVVVGLIA